MLKLRCKKCGSEFTLIRTDKQVISCPSCSALLPVADATVHHATKVRVEGRAVILEPSTNLTGKYRCTFCTKIFVFSTEKRDHPYCPFCDCTKVIPMTPLVRAVNTPDPKPMSRAEKRLNRFVRRNYRALVTAREYFGGIDNVVKRAGLPKEEEERLIKAANAMKDDILDTILRIKDAELERQMKELGIEDGKDIVKV